MLSRFLGRPEDGSVVIEPLRRKHLDGVMAIESVSYPKPWSAKVFINEIEMMRRGERCYLVARQRNEVVGYAGAMFVVGDAHVTNIAVSPRAQRKGFATRLLAELAWASIEHGAVALTLEVRVSNIGAQALYERFGFESAGVRTKYYENVEDAMVMWRHGIDEPHYRERLRALCPEAAR
ncbi:MAG: ribosomal protein S18-alanine N-acetyltransferase [Actinomycetota bacterium]